MSWLPGDFVHPRRVGLPTGRHHVRPIEGSDTEIDYPAVMGSRERLWTLFGPVWGWPPETMTVEEDRTDLIRHAVEAEAHESFNYCILDEDETVLLGCIYIDPPETEHIRGHDAEVCWWVVDDQVGTELEQAVDEFVPRWIHEAWPFTNPYIGLPRGD